jgi:hypothetical protein
MVTFLTSVITPVLSPDPGSPPARIGRRDPSYQLIKPQKFLSQVETAGVVQIENLER